MDGVTVPQSKSALKLFFEMMEDEDIPEEMLVQWMVHLGNATGKQDIKTNSVQIADYMVGTKGYEKGED